MSETTLNDKRLDELARFAQQSIRLGSKSFAGASRLFDAELKTSVQMLYAWCRHCDDVIDDQVAGFSPSAPSASLPSSVTERVRQLREQTSCALRGEAQSPPFAALAYVAARHRIPERYPMALLDGFEMDALGHRYRTLEDTIRYSYHVAGVVGIMMAMVMGVRDEPTLDRACDLGIGFQLTNIARDVIDDARVGRIYLPAQWLWSEPLDGREAEQAWLLDPANRQQLHTAVTRLLDSAEAYYDSSYEGLRDLPFRAACAIATARRVYRDIGRQVLARGGSAWDQRVVVSPVRKLGGALGGVLDSMLVHSLGRLRATRARGPLWQRPGR